MANLVLLLILGSHVYNRDGGLKVDAEAYRSFSEVWPVYDVHRQRCCRQKSWPPGWMSLSSRMMLATVGGVVGVLEIRPLRGSW
jgi:hypothetical protein